MGARERDVAQAGGFIAPPGYRRHRPEATLLYQLVAEHYPSFRDRRAAEGRPLPRYVEEEFEAYGISSSEGKIPTPDRCQIGRLGPDGGLDPATRRSPAAIRAVLSRPPAHIMAAEPHYLQG